MSENVLRHLIALVGTLICALAFLAGYASGGSGWWWTIFGVPIIYVLIVKSLGGPH